MDYTEIYNEKFLTTIKDKVNSIGEVKAVKFVREQTGMSLLEAKKLIDAVKA